MLQLKSMKNIDVERIYNDNTRTNKTSIILCDGNQMLLLAEKNIRMLPVKSFESFNKVSFCMNFRMPDTSFILAPEFCAYWIAGSLDPCIYFVCMIDESNTT